MNMEEDSIKTKNKDNFLFENLPGAEDMLLKTLPNKDLLYYPFTTQQNKSLNVFDFAYQKKGGETDESNPIEKANIPQQKNKKNQNQRKKNYFLTSLRSKKSSRGKSEKNKEKEKNIDNLMKKFPKQKQKIEKKKKKKLLI